MSDKITAVDASLSNEQAQRLRAFLSSGRKFTEENQAELNRILDMAKQQKAKITVCESCSCGTVYVTCTQYVWNGAGWVPVLVTLEQCSFLGRLSGCIFRLVLHGGP